ncbi:hypothetical protein NMG60_11019551 [Bertholletia excelsa]
MMHKKTGLIFLLISAYLLSTSFTGWSFYSNSSSLCVKSRKIKEQVSAEQLDDKGADAAHERLLKVDITEYGTYDPPPALVKPPPKSIPN